MTTDEIRHIFAEHNRGTHEALSALGIEKLSWEFREMLDSDGSMVVLIMHFKGEEAARWPKALTLRERFMLDRDGITRIVEEGVSAVKKELAKARADLQAVIDKEG